MSDTFSKKKRSQIMKSVKSKGNKSTELKLIETFDKLDLKGWRRNYPVKGKPDFVFLKPKVAVFADGCFWHGHNCRNVSPATNKEYWKKKIDRNKKRDKEVTRRLRNRGWKVFRIWECEIKKENIPSELVQAVKTSRR